jgi:SAM-dependent methyltransferase
MEQERYKSETSSVPLKTSLPSKWDRQAANWDRGIQSPKWPHYHYYKTFDLYLSRVLRNCTRVLELGFAQKVHLAILDGQNIPFTGECFDGVFSRGGLINYVPHPEVLLDEIYRVLRPRGKLVLDMITRRPGGEANIYSKNRVEEMLCMAGFTSADFRPMGMFLQLWRDRELMNFINEHRDIFCQIEVKMAKAFKPAKSAMTLILANKL